MLTKARSALIPTKLTLRGQGEQVTFNVVYHNRKQSDVVARLAESVDDVREVLLYMLESWESEYELSMDGLMELEDDRPGIFMALIDGFHQARKVAKAKN